MYGVVEEVVAGFEGPAVVQKDDAFRRDRGSCSTNWTEGSAFHLIIQLEYFIPVVYCSDGGAT